MTTRWLRPIIPVVGLFAVVLLALAPLIHSHAPAAAGPSTKPQGACATCAAVSGFDLPGDAAPAFCIPPLESVSRLESGRPPQAATPFPTEPRAPPQPAV